MKLIKNLAMATALAASVGGAQAAVISFTGTGGVVDSSSANRYLTVDVTDIAGYVDSILDINLTVDFSKCGSYATTSGCTGGSGYTYNREISFDLYHGGAHADIVNVGTFGGQSSNARVTQTYDDEAATDVGGYSLQNGSFRPEDSLSIFDGMSALGLWRFRFADSVGADPLAVHSWTVDIELAEVPVPEPATLAIFGLGIAGLGFARRKQSA